DRSVGSNRNASISGCAADAMGTKLQQNPRLTPGDFLLSNYVVITASLTHGMSFNLCFCLFASK
ncbi:MAG: hypothetical protein QM214_01980, partial [Bacillota bacterium]|nr:hypothetical protein [Bacillota bacterium]